LRTQGLQASVNATASISSNLDKAFPFNPNHEKPLISVLLLNKPLYGRPLELKSDSRIRESVLFILDSLVETGSSAAFRMRDDFVTPAQ